MDAIFYNIVRYSVHLAFRIFFKVTVINPEYLDHKPTIVVSNHPNTLTDAFLVGDQIKQRLYFLGNASLFVKYAWFFSIAAIPIERYKDTDGKPLDNDKAFERCDEFLGEGGVLYIAPEGGSKRGRRIRPLKTGTARIGFSAERKKNWRLGLEVIPTGVTYEDYEKFRGRVIIHIGKGLKITDYKSDYEKDDRGTVRKFTNDLDHSMRKLINHTTDEEEDEMLYKVEAVLQTEEPVSFENQYYRSKKILEHIRQQATESPEWLTAFKTSLNKYTDGIKSLKLKDHIIMSSISMGSVLLKCFLLIIGFPFFLYGYINNFLTHYIPSVLVKVVNTHREYTATLKIFFGIFCYPIFYGLQFYLVNLFFQNNMVTLIYALTILPLGWLAWEYMGFAKETFQYLRKGMLSKEKKEQLQELLVIRKSLANELI